MTTVPTDIASELANATQAFEQLIHALEGQITKELKKRLLTFYEKLHADILPLIKYLDTEYYFDKGIRGGDLASQYRRGILLGSTKMEEGKAIVLVFTRTGVEAWSPDTCNFALPPNETGYGIVRERLLSPYKLNLEDAHLFNPKEVMAALLTVLRTKEKQLSERKDLLAERIVQLGKLL